MEMNALAAGARQFGVELTPSQQQAFGLYISELFEWNHRMNLTSITDPEQVIVKHLLDSLSLAPVLRAAAPASLVDVGTGAGFPGVPLKIAFPDLTVTLLEATGKKVEFLQHIISELHLPNTTALHARAEDLARDPAHRERYDAAVARAVARLAALLELALPLVHVGGVFVAQKGVDVDEELHEAERALRTLGGRVREVVQVELPGLEPRHLVVVDKTAPTPAAYPRRPGIPERKPIR